MSKVETIVLKERKYQDELADAKATLEDARTILKAVCHGAFDRPPGFPGGVLGIALRRVEAGIAAIDALYEKGLSK